MGVNKSSGSAAIRDRDTGDYAEVVTRGDGTRALAVDSSGSSAAPAGDLIENKQMYEATPRTEQAVQASFSPDAICLLNEIVEILGKITLELKRIEHHQRVVTDQTFDDIWDVFNDEEF